MGLPRRGDGVLVRMAVKEARCQCALGLLANSPDVGCRQVLASRSKEVGSKRSWRLKCVVRIRKIDMMRTHLCFSRYL